MDVIRHFGLGHDAFRSAVEPEQAFESGPFVAARQQVMGALLRGARLIAVVGGAGAGKSLLLRAIEKTAVGGRGVMRVERADLAEAALASDNRVLLLDDADTLGDAAFARLAERTNEASGPRVILACEQRCLERLPTSVSPTLVRLPYLDAKESRAYLDDRVARAGAAGLFSGAALDILAEAGRGVPGALRVLGGNALFQAAFDGTPRVEEGHARQAAAMLQELWRPKAEPAPATAPASGLQPEPAEAAVVPMAAAMAPEPMRIAPAAAAERPEPAAVDIRERRSWWRSTPPLARLAMAVGLLLLCLPVLGYFVGAIKDDRPATESSYLPEGGGVAAKARVEPAQTAPPLTARAEAPAEPAPPARTPPVEVADVGMPQDLTSPVLVAEGAAAEVNPAPEPVEEEPQASAADQQPVAAPPAAPSDVAPATGRPRVFVHYSRSQPGASEAAEEVARALRDRGFEVVDIRDVADPIGQASVRYFYLADRQAAEALHDALGDVLRDRGFSAGDLKAMTDYSPLPRRGTVEVWVPASS